MRSLQRIIAVSWTMGRRSHLPSDRPGERLSLEHQRRGLIRRAVQFDFHREMPFADKPPYRRHHIPPQEPCNWPRPKRTRLVISVALQRLNVLRGAASPTTSYSAPRAQYSLSRVPRGFAEQLGARARAAPSVTSDGGGRAPTRGKREGKRVRLPYRLVRARESEMMPGEGEQSVGSRDLRPLAGSYQKIRAAFSSSSPLLHTYIRSVALADAAAGAQVPLGVATARNRVASHMTDES